MIAIIPAAGQGQRMQSITNGTSKEMLLIMGIPVIEYVIKEAAFWGAEEVWVVSNPSKSDLNAYLKETHPSVRIEWQKIAKGLGDAVSRVEASGDAMILLGDTILFQSLVQAGNESVNNLGSQPPTHTRGDVHYFKNLLPNVKKAPIVGRIFVESVPKSSVHKYGIIEADPNSPHLVKSIVEKPNQAAPSDLAIAARYWFSQDLRTQLREYVQAQTALDRNGSGEPGEIGLSQFINSEIHGGKQIDFEVLPTTIKRVDCGDPKSYSELLGELKS